MELPLSIILCLATYSLSASDLLVEAGWLTTDYAGVNFGDFIQRGYAKVYTERRQSWEAVNSCKAETTSERRTTMIV